MNTGRHSSDHIRRDTHLGLEAELGLGCISGRSWWQASVGRKGVAVLQYGGTLKSSKELGDCSVPAELNTKHV